MDTDTSDRRIALHSFMGLDAATQSVTAIKPVAYLVQVRTDDPQTQGHSTQWHRIEIS